jgi:hypothetical protein
MRHSVIAIGFFTIVFAALLATSAAAHPASGIVVDDKGQVYFQGGRAIWKVDAQGKLTKYHDKLGGHWMALDPEGSFARAEPKLVERITPSGVKPALLVADGGAPVAVGGDGNLYYALRLLEGGGVECGITRISPDGKRSRFVPDLEKKLVEKDGITGLATGPDGSLYVACPSAILKVKLDGTFTTLVSPVVVKDCDEESKDRNPYLRGLAVDRRGTVYAAANGCHCVVKITSAGKVETLLKAERPWSPTGMAVFGEDVYVLEYTNSLKGWYEGEGWQPRVRKLGRDGKVTTLAMVALAWPQDDKTPPSPKKVPDGVYAVLRESLKKEDVLPLKEGEVLVVHHARYLKEDNKEPPHFLVVHSAPDVVLDLASKPKALKEGTEVVRISLKLQPKAATALERLTRDHLGRQLTIVLGEEVVTMHKIREVIKGGHAQISCCAAGSANYLLEQLEAYQKNK